MLLRATDNCRTRKGRPTMSIEPTGRRETRGFGEAVVFDRRLPAGIDDVWAAFADPERLQRWIGVWEGDPESGTVVFRMTAEGDDVPEETVRIQECTAPTRLRLRIGTLEDPDRYWDYEIDLAEDGGSTILTFATTVAGVHPVSDTAPGWEYYLDRLVAAHSGEDVAAIDFSRDYYPAMSEHYRSLFA
jgi:uncharacterized protein YndB with AHSA1/START domain